MSFDPCNRPLKIHSWFAPLQALALVANPRLRLQQFLLFYFFVDVVKTFANGEIWL
jgi:hypothetical protein